HRHFSAVATGLVLHQCSLWMGGALDLLPGYSFTSTRNPPKITRLPSNGISLGTRGSSITAFMPASRASREGHTIQENTTVSSSLRWTAIGIEVSLPSGTSSPQHSMT